MVEVVRDPQLAVLVNNMTKEAIGYDCSQQVRVLLAISSYGVSNDQHLMCLLREYRTMPYLVDIVVFSNITRDLGPDVKVVIGLPTKDPWSLPFAHKQLFVDRSKDYDLFIYSEDDTLITRNHVDAFLRVSVVLADDEVTGFFRCEKDEDGRVSYPDVHWDYHWDIKSVSSKGGYTFAFFTNEHAACYILTRTQLQRVISSGGFLVGPHRGKYGLPESAATDPYTQCGLTKLICISHFNDFLVHHLPNKYVGKLGLDAPRFECQIQALLKIAAEGDAPGSLLDRHPEFKASQFGKNYYEPVRKDLVSLIPARARTVLSIGCGWGATEKYLAQSGRKVVAVPLDAIISTCAQAGDVEIVQGDLNTATSRLSGEKFDCLLISNMLHLVPDPGEVLAALTPLLSDEAIVIAAIPNLLRASVLWRKWRGVESHRFLGDYARSGVHSTSHEIVRIWLSRGGLRVDRFVDVLPEGAKTVCRGTFGLITPLVSDEIVAVAARG
jgi:2-polyprenyl-3-methyl-5-hydroxy-6-metoxy-1,4-benzoquinol methylase